MKEKDFINLKQKVTDDIVSLKTSEGVSLRAGITVNINGIFRVIGKTKQGRIIATELTSEYLTQIETKDENLNLVSRDEKKFRKIYGIIAKTKQTKRLSEAANLF